MLRHRDVFHELVRPKVAAEVAGWDNMAADKEYNAHDHSSLSDPLESNAWKSFQHCRAVCEGRSECLQFAYRPGSCSVNFSFKLGYARAEERVRSGWMVDRVEELFLGLEAKCGIRDWFSPVEGSHIHDQQRKRR